jgi:hypothetical protein
MKLEDHVNIARRREAMAERNRLAAKIIRHHKGICSVCGTSIRDQKQWVVKMNPLQKFVEDNLCLLCDGCHTEYQYDVSRFDEYNLHADKRFS